MAKLKLDHNSALLAQCEPGKSKTDYYDTVTTGFVLECRATAGKTYYLRFDNDGRQKQLKIGRYEDISFAAAKKAAQRLRSEVVLGGNPAGKRDDARAMPTYAEFSVRHLAHARTYQRSFDTTEMIMRRHIIPRWGKLRMAEIAKQDVAQWLSEKTADGLALATVEKIRVILGRSFSLAMEWDVPGVIRNPTHGIKRPPINNARTRYLNADEANRLQRAVKESRNTQLPYIIGLLLLTGARLAELLNAEWCNVDIDRRSWLIPHSKTGRSRHVPLSQAAVDLISQIPRFGDCPYLLPNPATLKPFTEIKHAWQMARDKALLPGLHLHDLRHASASFMINAGVDLFAVGRILGHADHKSTMRYGHLANGTLLAAVEAGAAGAKLDWTADA